MNSIKRMAHILVAEDNASYAADLAEFLEEIGHGVRVVGSAGALWTAFVQEAPDVLILDLGLPDEDGFQLIPRLRQHYPDVGLLVLTARVTSDNRILGLRLGADTYLTKPIKFPELAAHVDALCRRMRPQTRPSATPLWRLRHHDRQLELKDSGTIPLTNREFAFLHMLVMNARPVQRDSLLIGIGITDDLEGPRKLDMLVYRLRRKTKTRFGEELPLLSSYGEGYSLGSAVELA